MQCLECVPTCTTSHMCPRHTCAHVTHVYTSHTCPRHTRAPRHTHAHVTHMPTSHTCPRHTRAPRHTHAHVTHMPTSHTCRCQRCLRERSCASSMVLQALQRRTLKGKLLRSVQRSKPRAFHCMHAAYMTHVPSFSPQLQFFICKPENVACNMSLKSNICSCLSL